MAKNQSLVMARVQCRQVVLEKHNALVGESDEYYTVFKPHFNKKMEMTD